MCGRNEPSVDLGGLDAFFSQRIAFPDCLQLRDELFVCRA
jgi:hypothetical protein